MPQMTGGELGRMLDRQELALYNKLRADYPGGHLIVWASRAARDWRATIEAMYRRDALTGLWGWVGGPLTAEPGGESDYLPPGSISGQSVVAG